MATRAFRISAEGARLAPDDFDQLLKNSEDSILLLGETGTGKTSVARFIHALSKEGIGDILYKSGSAGASEAVSAINSLGVSLYQNIVPAKPMYDTLKPVKQCLDDSIDILDAVLDAYDEEVERETLLNLLKEKIEDLWAQRDKYNKNFLDVVVQLKVVSRIADHEVLSETQVESLKKVFSFLKKIEITKEDRLFCWKTLESSGIDLNAPIKGYENLELVLREKPHRK
jgi:ABC-type dipeptide/oligopeptide/nickel transport system ATPase subunit